MSYVVGLPNNSYNKPITNTVWVRARFVNYKKGALNSQQQVIKLTSCLPMVGGSLRALFHHWSPWYSWNIAESGVYTPKINQNQIFKITFVFFFIYCRQHHERKTTCLDIFFLSDIDSVVPNPSIYSAVFFTSPYYN